MKCPFCGFYESKVVDSRPTSESIKRRRECLKCKGRFTSYEIVEKPLLMVEKRGKSFEPFNKEKLIKGIFTAIIKRPVTIDQVEEIAANIETICANELRSTITSKEIGEMVLEQLKGIDPVAYIRFASVYKDFSDIESFVAAISELEK